jgi:hypothetical protein
MNTYSQRTESHFSVEKRYTSDHSSDALSRLLLLVTANIVAVTTVAVTTIAVATKDR